MRPQVDLHIARIAETQGGVIDHDQLASLGVGLRGISHRIEGGRLHRIHRGVYAVGRPGLREDGRWWAAVLACGPTAALSHLSAAALWGLRPSAATRVHVVVPSQAGRAQPGIAIHRCASLVPEEVTTRDGIPVTTVARTLLDVARTAPPRVLARCVEGAENARVFDLAEVHAILARHAGRAGTKRLAAAVGAYEETPPTRSPLERRFLALCRRYGIPAPSVNATLLGSEVDFHWPGERLVVETDGREVHGTPAAFERDRARDAELAVAGFRVVRFTDLQVRRRPDTVAATVRALLGLSGARPAGARRRAGRRAS